MSQYEKLDPRTHVLKRPDMYIGSVRSTKKLEWIAPDISTIQQKEISYSPALLRVFIECLSNAIDNIQRKGEKCTKIKVWVDEETGYTKVMNDGAVIPITEHPTEKIYNHSLIFGQLLTGSNYDDTKERMVSGRNGIGGKATNIFSKHFKVIGVDPKEGKKLTQIWTDNMSKTKGPKVTQSKLKSGYTEVEWVPDFERFGLSNYTKDIINLYRKYVIDTAMLTGVKVYWNDEQIKVKSLLQYVKLFKGGTDEYFNIKTNDCEIVLQCLSDDDKGWMECSFVNGIHTRGGGSHVQPWVETLLRPIISKLSPKKGKVSLNMGDIKPYFRIWVVAQVNRPEFDSQEKNVLMSPTVRPDVKDSMLKKIMKSSSVQEIQEVLNSKIQKHVAKTEKLGKGRVSYIKVDGLDDANWAGKAGKSQQCILILCEGLSAKTYAIAGIQRGIGERKGRNWFGVLALTGKLLNVRNSTLQQSADNKVVQGILKTMGIQRNVDYTKEQNFNTLRYGQICLLCDSDVDGVHIESLLLNLLDVVAPTLLKRTTPFVMSMKTPICRVLRGNKTEKLFYDESHFHHWYNTTKPSTQLKIKYYKGLGTTRQEDVPDTFAKKMLEFKEDQDSKDTLNKVFHKKQADVRKKWLGQYDPSVLPKDHIDTGGVVTPTTISRFLNRELVKFSWADCQRSIPAMVDGLKESQRKILFAVMKKGLGWKGQTLKVAQLAGYTAEVSLYHHGEQNLQDTIIGLAQNFKGSNNIPLLYRDGMFGTLLEGGKDAASARYIYTKMDSLTEKIFCNADEPVLSWCIEDGIQVQPHWYCPILPMILVNGCSAGIGTGWSSMIPCYHPVELIECIQEYLSNGKFGNTTLIPWYRGMTEGSIKKDGCRYVSMGQFSGLGKKWTVTELPVGFWTSKFKDHLDKLRDDKIIKEFINHSTPDKVNFDVKFVNDMSRDNVEKVLKLTNYISTSNMVLFDSSGKIKRYSSVKEILKEFCTVRVEMYRKRHDYQLKQLKKELVENNTKRQFIRGVVSKEIPLLMGDIDRVETILKSENFPLRGGSYSYLLDIPVKNFTLNKVKELEKKIEDIKGQIRVISSLTPENDWLRDLDGLKKCLCDSM